MNIQHSWSPAGAGRQKGVAILVITILLLLVATLGTLMIGRVGVFEQRAVGSDVRNKEVYSAAVGGLEYGVNWFGNNYRAALEDGTFAFTGGAGGACPDRGATAQPLQGLDDTTLNADTYSHNITYTLKSCTDRPDVDGMPIIVEVASQATAAGDSHINKTVSVEVMFGLSSMFANGTGDFNGPPIVVEECMQSTAGNPDIYPASDGDMSGVAVGTTRGSTDCLDEGSHLTYHDGGYETAHDPPQSAWDTIFGPSVTEEDLRALEEDDPAHMHFVDATYPHYPDSQPNFNGNNWHADLGSPDDPVVMYIDDSAGCPGANGSPTIYGIVYFEEPCTSEGWGGTTIHGTVVVEGDMTRINANIEIYGTALDFQDSGIGGVDSGRPISRYAEIPGSWKDF